MSNSVIICIDDENIILRSLQSELRNITGGQYIIEIAESGEEALEVIEDYLSRNYQIPLVICDYYMPQMKGDETLAQIHQLVPHTLKIMLTGQSNLEGITHAINHADLYRYISKPWITSDMAMTIRQALKSFEQDRELERKNRALAELNNSLEIKIEERTQALNQAYEELNQANAHLLKTIHKIQVQHEIISEKNREIISSINYAKRIQQAILPQDKQMQEYLGDHFVIYRPRDIVSGDFYWCEKIEQPVNLIKEDAITGKHVYQSAQMEKITIAAVDCTGHGVSGAFMSMIGNDLLNHIVLQNHIYSPDKILNQLHKGIRTSLRQESTLVFDGMEIALCIIDAQAGLLEFAGAKSPLIVIQNHQLAQIPGDKWGIGGHPLQMNKYEERTYRKMIIDISTETFCYIFSDGLQDQFGGPRNRKFMINRLRKVLLQIHQLPFGEQKEYIENMLDKWQGDNRQTDDILLIGFKC